MTISDKTKVLVVGQGSIGRRHARILNDLGIRTACVTRQNDIPFTSFVDVSTGLTQWQPDYVVVASPTSQHVVDLLQLLGEGFGGPVLVEKPLFSRPEEFHLPPFQRIFIGYNWRFHDAIMRLRKLVKDQRILTASIYNAQYLPDWRPSRDYRATSSAQRNLGGGVLRDLSHDLDLMLLLFGDVRDVFARILYSGSLEINTEDTVSASFVTELCPAVNLYLSYLDRVPRHEIVLTTDQSTIVCNLLTGAISENGEHEFHQTERDVTFRRMHIAVLEGNSENLCDIEDALKTVRLIHTIEETAIVRRMSVS